MKNIIFPLTSLKKEKSLFTVELFPVHFLQNTLPGGTGLPHFLQTDFFISILEVLIMNIKKNLIRGMQTIGQMRAVFGE